MLLDMLARSQESEDKLATDRKRALALLATIRKQGYSERDPMVEPRSVILKYVSTPRLRVLPTVEPPSLVLVLVRLSTGGS